MPSAYAHCFTEAAADLQSHRGWDPGAAELAVYVASQWHAPLYAQSATRLLVECNRSLDHDQLFSSYTRNLPAEIRERILRDHYHRYRNGVEQELERMPHPVLHLSVHTFTPVWDGHERAVDIGILFDESRKEETAFCRLWRSSLEKKLPGLRIRFNEPYRGVDDGFTTYLRQKFPGNQYLGIELEVNQKWHTTDDWLIIAGKIAASLETLLAG